VRDDGCGLPPGWEQARVDHRGLRDALELVQAVRGAVATAEAAAPSGTVIRARVPWRPRARRAEEDQTMHGEDTITVLIAEDHAVMRQGLRRLLAEDERLVVVAEACTGYEILGLVIQHQPDVLLLDLDLPGQSGLAALRSVQEHIARPPRTLVLSAFHAEEYVCRARELGVAGFLSKESCDGERLREAIHRIMAGEQRLDPAIAAIAQQQTYSAKGRFRRYSDGSKALTRAELDVLRGMLEGHSYEEIAVALGCEHGTVRSQAASICSRLAVSTRGQAVRKALQLGILHVSDAPHGNGACDSTCSDSRGHDDSSPPV
jgi:DNA-binding NarL/FixJ family response regulator